MSGEIKKVKTKLFLVDAQWSNVLGSRTLSGLVSTHTTLEEAFEVYQTRKSELLQDCPSSANVEIVGPNNLKDCPAAAVNSSLRLSKGTDQASEHIHLFIRVLYLTE